MNCSLCQANTPMTEAHVIMSCEALAEMRKYGGITNWCTKNDLSNHTNDEKLRQYLGDDGAVGFVLKKRGKFLIEMRNKFLSKVQEKYEKDMSMLNELDLWQRANFDLNSPTAVYGQEHTIWDSWNTIMNETA